MEPVLRGRPSHKEWRRSAKRERRRRLRQKTARERDADAERLRAALERSAGYLNWLSLERTKELELEEQEEEERKEKERMWLEEEVRAQKEWRIHQERKARARQEQLEQEKRIRQEYEAKQEILRLKKEEEKRKQEEELQKQQDLQQQIDDYIDKGTKTPEPLRMVTNSQPGKDPCPFFTKTGACRYGDTCSRNHQRVALSKVILIPGFYSHFSLEKNSAEYDTDVCLEFENSETRQHFTEFYKDVVPELESFGRIKTLKYCFNTEIHLRGNLYVEYYSERDAARALRKLKGRWYAGRQLNCEFTNIKAWRNAVCGMIKCPKGRACNFLHTFRNPNDEYDIKSPPRWSSKEGTSSRRSDHRSSRSTWEDSVRSGHGGNGAWRWSESPEPEQDEDRSRRRDKRRRRSGHDRRYDDVDKGEEHRYAASSSRNHGQRRSRRLSEGEGRGEDDLAESSRKPGHRQVRRRDREADDPQESGTSSSRRSEFSDGRKQERDNRKSTDRHHSSKHDYARANMYGRTSGKRKADEHIDRKQESKYHDEITETNVSTSTSSKTITKAAETTKTNARKTDSRKREKATKVEGPKSKWDDSELSISDNESDTSSEVSMHCEGVRKKESKNRTKSQGRTRKRRDDDHSDRKYESKHNDEIMETSSSTSSKVIVKGVKMAGKNVENIDYRKIGGGAQTDGPKSKWDNSELSVSDSGSDTSENIRKQKGDNPRSTDRHHSSKHDHNRTKSHRKGSGEGKTDGRSGRNHEFEHNDEVMQTTKKVAEIAESNVENIDSRKVEGETKVEGPKPKRFNRERGVSGSGSDRSSEFSESSINDDEERTVAVEKRKRITRSFTDGWDTTDSESDKK